MIVWEGCHVRLPQQGINSDWLTGSLAVFQQHARQKRQGMTNSVLDVVWIEVILEEKPFNELLILYHFAIKDQDTLCCSLRNDIFALLMFPVTHTFLCNANTQLVMHVTRTCACAVPFFLTRSEKTTTYRLTLTLRKPHEACPILEVNLSSGGAHNKINGMSWSVCPLKNLLLSKARRG